VMFAVQNEREWTRFCAEVLAQPELSADPRYSSNENRLKNRAALEAEIERSFAHRTRAEVARLLEGAGIASAAVNTVPDVIDHPQLKARGRWTEVQTSAGPIPALLPPHNLLGAPPRMGRVPALGEHTAEVLAELGNRS
jgi:itaconate CoA-transferase